MLTRGLTGAKLPVSPFFLRAVRLGIVVMASGMEFGA